MNLLWIKELLNSAFGIIKEPVVEWQKRKTVQVKAKMEVEMLHAEATVERAKATVELAKAGMQIQSDWDTNAQKAALTSLKDEILMLLLFSPVLMLFLSAFMPPDFQAKIISGVVALEQFPTWYVILLIGIVASTFGLRWMVKPMLEKMNKKL
jgi:hypothetical protein